MLVNLFQAMMKIFLYDYETSDYNDCMKHSNYNDYDDYGDYLICHD